MIIYSDVEDLIKQRDELQKKIDRCKDYFFIYGYVKKLEEINKLLRLKSAQA